MGRGVRQIFEDRAVEIPPFERLQRIGVESERLVDRVDLPAQLADDRDEEFGRASTNLQKLSAVDMEHLRRARRLDARGARQSRNSSDFANEPRRLDSGERHGSVTRLCVDLQRAALQEEGAVAIMSLMYKDVAWLKV